MKKWCALLLILTMAFALTACSSNNPEKIAATVVAEVDNIKITKGEALEVYDFVYKQMLSYAMQYGSSVTEKDVEASAKLTTLTLMTEGVVLEKKLDALGLRMSDAEKEAFDQSVLEEYDSLVQIYSNYYGLLEEEIRDILSEQGNSLKAYQYFSYQDKVKTLLRDVSVEGITATEDEMQEKYNELVAASQETYASSPSQFGTDVLNDSTYYYRPEGYRYIKNLLIGLPDSISEQISQKQNEMMALLNEGYQLQIDLSGVSNLEDEERTAKEESLSSLEAEFERLDEEVTALEAQGLEEIREEVERILALCKAPGADFDALMREYSIDNPSNDIVVQNGYPVCDGSTTYVETFTQGAMALEKVGDISDLIASSYGYHILQYYGDIASGPVPFEEVREAVELEVLTAKQDEAFAAKQAEWIAEAKIKTYVSKL